MRVREGQGTTETVMNTACYWIFQSCLLLILLSVTSLGLAKGLTDKFRAYILQPNLASPSVATERRFPQPLGSHHCMQCHDGSGGKPISLKHAESKMRFVGRHNVDHPVGMNYASYAYDNPAVFVAPALLDKRIILENGEVTCLACHETKASSRPEPSLLKVTGRHDSSSDADACTATNRLTTGTNQTTLCLSCHDI
jgi:hypothetical protein